MNLLRRLLPYTTLALAVAVAYMGWKLLSRRAPEPPRAGPGIPAEYLGTDLRILQFYGAPAPLIEGETAVICYGILNAASARIEPEIGAVSPSLNRCLNIAPRETTRYTMTAEGRDGKTVTASFELTVKPDPETHPKILSFTKGRREKAEGRTIYTLCFETRNASVVGIEPRVFHPGPLLRGCFYAPVARTTTYVLTASDDHGRKAERKLTVEGP
jgi:hypothetical protein